MPKGGHRAGAGRKPSRHPKAKISITIDPAINNWLAEVARELGTNKSDLVNTILSKEKGE